MSQSAGTNQMPTSATNQQDSTSGASTSPNYGGAGAVYQPAQVHPNQFASPTSGGAMTGGIAPPAPAAPAANPFSDPTQATQPTGVFAAKPANPFSDPTQPAPQAAPPPGTAPNPFSNFVLPTAQGDYTIAVKNQPGVFTNAAGYTNQQTLDANAKAMQLRDIAMQNGYKFDGNQTAMAQYAAMLPYATKPAPGSYGASLLRQ